MGVYQTVSPVLFLRHTLSSDRAAQFHFPCAWACWGAKRTAQPPAKLHIRNIPRPGAELCSAAFSSSKCTRRAPARRGASVVDAARISKLKLETDPRFKCERLGFSARVATVTAGAA